MSRLDHRAQSFRHKQAQLYRLYETLIRSADKVKLATQSDSFLSSTEADYEFARAMSELRTHYESLDLQTELQATRKVVTGVENVEMTKPIGIVYIIPYRRSLVFSVLAALGAAVAAGSCVVVEVRSAALNL
jgi:acyl-CoA reductase-like NAD-dependent aldehyde dehydrogenase